MSGSSAIEWTDVTWNPVVGCTRVSPGCQNCYAERHAARLEGNPKVPAYDGISKSTEAGPRWTGQVRLIPDRLDWPLRYTGHPRAKEEGRPTRIFVNSMSDLFHEQLTNEQIAAVFGVMAAAPQHTFQVLTKRAERMRQWFEWVETQTGNPSAPWNGLWLGLRNLGLDWVYERFEDLEPMDAPWPIPHIHLGVSAEDQPRADQRIPELMRCPAAVRFISYEPSLGPLRLDNYLVELAGPGTCVTIDGEWWHEPGSCSGCRPRLDWVIAGGESGPGARVPQRVEDGTLADWFRQVRDQCEEAGVPFLFKQWGRHAHYSQLPERARRHLDANGDHLYTDSEPAKMQLYSLGKRWTGRQLDGRTHDAFPEPS